MERVKATATVDDLGYGQYEVQVTGLEPHDHRRVYTIGAVTVNRAAFEGLRQFEDEMLSLYGGLETDDNSPTPTA